MCLVLTGWACKIHKVLPSSEIDEDDIAIVDSENWIKNKIITK